MQGKGSCLIAATLMTALSGCTLEPNYQRPASPVPSIDNAGAAGTPAVDIGWREFFPDPQLQRLIGLALTENRDLRVASLNVQNAWEQWRIQRAPLFPAINGTASETVQKIPLGVLAAEAPPSMGGASTSTATNGITTRIFDIGAGFTSYELDLFGRIRSSSHAALQEYLSSGEARRSVQITLVSQVAITYVTILADQTLLRITGDTLKSQQQTFALTQKLFSGGATTELAVRQAEGTVRTAEGSIAQYRRQLAQDRDELQLLVGASLPSDFDISAGLDRENMIADIEEGIPSDVLVNRPDVLAAEHQLMAANAQIGAARAAFFPSITLTGNLGTESTQLSGLFKPGSYAWTFAPQVTVPIFAGGANLANLQATKIARDTAVAQYEKAIQTAFHEVADALVARATLEEQLQAQQALAATLQRAYRLADLRYRSGVDSYLSALDAQRSLYAAQQQLQTVRLLRLQNLVTLYKTLGGGGREHALSAKSSLVYLPGRWKVSN
jgi:outer membrane protein, multidrug efflux system